LQTEIPAPLSTPEFFERVHALNPKIAVFDCDGTLWSGDAGSSFMWWSIETGLLPPDMVTFIKRRYDGYLRGEVSEIVICGEMVQIYMMIEIDRLREAAATFFREKIEKNIFPEMLQLVTDLQHNGVDIWAVSSTNDWVVEEGVKRFNIPANRVLAARTEAVGGVATNRLLAVPTDEGKVTALHLAGVTAPDAVFGNSVHDAAMLAIARGAFPVNPTPALVERSIAEGWRVYYPASVAPPSA
jgi:phosphoserine phosphatase